MEAVREQASKVVIKIRFIGNEPKEYANFSIRSRNNCLFEPSEPLSFLSSVASASLWLFFSLLAYAESTEDPPQNVFIADLSGQAGDAF